MFLFNGIEKKIFNSSFPKYAFESVSLYRQYPTYICIAYVLQPLFKQGLTHLP